MTKSNAFAEAVAAAFGDPSRNASRNASRLSNARAALAAARRRGLAVRRLARLARRRHGIQRRWRDDHGHQGVCVCGVRVTGRSALERDQVLVRHIAESA